MNEISTIAGDRLCVGCGFNLTGQPVVREETYELLIARCPECGTVAPLQEYPMLGKWARRLAALMAGAFTLTLVSVLLISSLSLFGVARGMSQTASMPVAADIAIAYFDHVAAKVEAGDSITIQADIAVEAQLYQAQAELDGAAPVQTQPFPVVNTQGTQPAAKRDPSTLTDDAIEIARNRYVNQWATIDDAWWETQRPSTFLAEAGGHIGLLLEVPPEVWIFFVVISFLFAMLLSILMLHRRRRWLVGFGLLPVALSFAFMLIWPPRPTNWFGMWGTQAQSLAEMVAWPSVRLATLVLAYVSIVVGMLVGRSLARFMLTLLLPPRLRCALAPLWSCDGRPVPRP